jgi:agmatinase
LPIGGDLYVNLDVDALDPSEMPAVIGPGPGGLAFRQALAIIEKACSQCWIVGFSLAELHPFLNTNGFSALTAGRLICNAIGRIARQQ